MLPPPVDVAAQAEHRRDVDGNNVVDDITVAQLTWLHVVSVEGNGTEKSKSWCLISSRQCVC